MFHTANRWGDDKVGVEFERDVTVLVIEDSPEWALIAEQRLLGEPNGCATVVHHTSLEAAKGTLLEGGFDCVLLDLMLPDSSGLETVRGVRTRAPQAPIVVLSSEEDESIALRAVHEGAQDYLVKGRADGSQLCRAIRNAIDRKVAELELAHRATHDELTGLPNRTLFLDRLALTLGRLERRSRAAAVLFLDLDRFKTVNDRFGHEVGDQLLAAVAARLQYLLRPGDTVARFGGDEFMLLCDDIASEEDATVVADRLGAELELPFEVGDGVEVTVGASIGIAVAEDRSRSPEALVRDADRGMYAAKRRSARWELVRPGEEPTPAAPAVPA
jgi:two-component system cell cycle response regulator